MPNSEKTEYLCPLCSTQSKVSATELYQAKKNNKKALIACCFCGGIAKLLSEQLPDVGILTVEKWSEELAYDGENDCLPCLPFTGPESKLPSGAYVGPGDEMSPRLWRYRTADLSKSPSGDTWWTWEEFVKHFGTDPFIKLYKMRMPNNPRWLAFMTKGMSEKIEGMHLRTRVVV